MLKTQDATRMRWRFAAARELFEAARDASHDMDRVGSQLQELRDRTNHVGGGAMEPHAVGTPNPHAAQERMNAAMDREAKLERRMAEDEETMDVARDVLYGTDRATGLSSLVPAWWCDVLWWRYLDHAKWPEVAKAVDYSEQRCRQVAELAFDTIDAWGIVGTVLAVPLNDYDTWEKDRLRALEDEKD